MRRFFKLAVAAIIAVLAAASSNAEEASWGREIAELPALKVSDNGRFLMTTDGKPFFWLGDTAWHMFGKSSRDETELQPSAALYFRRRAEQGFNVIQSVLVRESDQGVEPNADGHLPFVDDDWSRPLVKQGPENDFWDHIGWCLAEAAANGLYVAVLPMWLNSVPTGHAMEHDPQVAYRYGHFLGTRYGRLPHIVWTMGGDPWTKGRNVDVPSRKKLVQALAEGIADGAAGTDAYDGQADWSRVFMTFHPRGGNHSSSEQLHEEPWLDINMIQTTTRFSFSNWQTVSKDYALEPPKPTLDAEVAYEDSLSLNKKEPQDRRIRPWDVRRAAYWAVFAGACGHTYGHRSYIGWIRKGETYRYGAHIPWYESLDAPGARQMIHLRRLMEAHSLFDRIPDQSLISGDPGKGDDHLQATRASDGSYAMVYSPRGKAISVDMSKLAGVGVQAYWFDPRTGERKSAGRKTAEGVESFAPPTQGDGNDWVLLLESMK
ncbi:MAG: glycoside hydrolase family 140 protein [Planctomycetota bacterium]